MSSLLLLVAVISISGCRKDKEAIFPPVVETNNITSIGNNSAISGGTITDDGNAFITGRGVCWDVNPMPVSGMPTSTSDGVGTGTYESILYGLEPDQKYYLRAYATNAAGTSYGTEISFRTPRLNTIVYREDGRTVKYGDPWPIVLDVTGDGTPDYTIFVELTANSAGDRLYAGINPLGSSLIKSGPPIFTNFLNMGYLIDVPKGSLVNENLQAGEYWTGDHSTLVIRNTYSDGKITYEGNWSNGSRIAGIQHSTGSLRYFGWLRVDFNKESEIVTLIDYAYDSVANQPVIAGAKSLNE